MKKISSCSHSGQHLRLFQLAICLLSHMQKLSEMPVSHLDILSVSRLGQIRTLLLHPFYSSFMWSWKCFKRAGWSRANCCWCFCTLSTTICCVFPVCPKSSMKTIKLNPFKEHIRSTAMLTRRIFIILQVLEVLIHQPESMLTFEQVICGINTI